MKKLLRTIILLLIMSTSFYSAIAKEVLDIYPSHKKRVASPGNTTYYINPTAGNDTHSGLNQKLAWKTFAPVNGLNLTAGDVVKIIEPGDFDQTLMITGSGSKKVPIKIHFAPGRYNFFPSNALRRKYQISNTNDDPDGEKAIGILFDGAKHVQLTGPGARFVYRGKMIEVCIDGSEDISISELQFDYHRPTVSEFRCTAIEQDYVDIEIHQDSKYEIKDGRITWIGEGWSYQDGLAQELLETNQIWRCGNNPLKELKLVETKPYHIRAVGKHDMKLGRVYQIRNTRRDCAGAFTRRSKDIHWQNVQFYFLHGMGLVNQFSENLTFDTVSIAPDPDSGRTCAAWADGIQVSGCRGKVIVKNCTFSGANDDAINIHGTHLRVIQQISDTQVKVRFMNTQTFGFMAFNPGDEITFAHSDSLKTYGPNTVKAAEMMGDKEMLLTLVDPVPAEFRSNDVVENVTWTPEVVITGCKVMRIPTRGFLITTRRKVVVEDNYFHRTTLSAILLENDAKRWYESGPVRDMTIRNNRFFLCAEPVINMNPQNSVANNAVHQNIRIEGNHFALRRSSAVKGKSTKGLIVMGNTIYSDHARNDQQIVQTTDCTDVRIEKNRFLPRSEWANKSDAEPASPVPASFKPGEIWKDDQNVHINAHGGGVIFHDGSYYWFGEHKVPGRAGNRAQVGVHVYSSKDLTNWKDEGIALQVSDDPNSDIVKGCIIERPKVIYNAKTQKFVMWFHLELKGRGYDAARSGIAISDTPAGPYTYLRSIRPNAGQWPLNVTAEEKDPASIERTKKEKEAFSGGPSPKHAQFNILGSHFEGGQMARDMNLFVDDDGKAYHIYSSEHNSTLHISLLTEDYLDHTGTYTRNFPFRWMEAPAVFKRGGKYYLIASGCTGWAPNAARSAVADSILGPWKELGNPCVGINPQNQLGPERTFGGQSTCVFPVSGQKDAYIAMFDIWRPEDAIDGRYVWLPVTFNGESFQVEWSDEWGLSLLTPKN